MSFKSGNLYRNSKALDVDFYILSILSEDSFGLECRVLYWNRNHNNIIDYQSDLVKIQKKDFPNWKRLDQSVI